MTYFIFIEHLFNLRIFKITEGLQLYKISTVPRNFKQVSNSFAIKLQCSQKKVNEINYRLITNLIKLDLKSKIAF